MGPKKAAKQRTRFSPSSPLDTPNTSLSSPVTPSMDVNTPESESQDTTDATVAIEAIIRSLSDGSGSHDDSPFEVETLPVQQSPVEHGAATPAPRTKKIVLTLAQEMNVVEWLSSHPEFWDKTDVNYPCKERNDAKMQAFSDELGVPKDVVARWIKSQRTLLGKDMRSKKYPPSGSATVPTTARAAWRASNLAFLSPHIAVRTAVLGSSAGWPQYYTHAASNRVTSSNSVTSSSSAGTQQRWQ